MQLAISNNPQQLLSQPIAQPVAQIQQNVQQKQQINDHTNNAQIQIKRQNDVAVQQKQQVNITNQNKQQHQSVNIEQVHTDKEESINNKNSQNIGQQMDNQKSENQVNNIQAANFNQKQVSDLQKQKQESKLQSNNNKIVENNQNIKDNETEHYQKVQQDKQVQNKQTEQVQDQVNHSNTEQINNISKEADPEYAFYKEVSQQDKNKQVAEQDLKTDFNIHAQDSESNNVHISINYVQQNNNNQNKPELTQKVQQKVQQQTIKVEENKQQKQLNNDKLQEQQNDPKVKQQQQQIEHKNQDENKKQIDQANKLQDIKDDKQQIKEQQINNEANEKQVKNQQQQQNSPVQSGNKDHESILGSIEQHEQNKQDELQLQCEKAQSINQQAKQGGQSDQSIMQSHIIKKHPQRIAFTEQNQGYNTLPQPDIESNRKIQFVEYTHGQDSTRKKKVQTPSRHSDSLPQAYQNIQNESLMKRIQQLEQTVKQLKEKQQKVNKNKDKDEEIEGEEQKTVEKHDGKVSQKKKKQKQLVIHDQSVHSLVTELAKNQQQNGSAVKKPSLHEKRYKRRKLDLTALMDKNMSYASNIFNVTIGQLLDPNAKHQEEKEILKKEIRLLRDKVVKLEQDNRAMSTHKPPVDTRRQTASTGKKSMCGKLVKVSQLRASRISGFDDNDSIIKTNIHNDISDINSQRDSRLEGITLKNKVSSNSVTQRDDRPKQNSNNLSFRVKRPSAKSGLNQNQRSSSSYINASGQYDRTSNLPVSNAKVVQSSQNLGLKKQWWQQPFITDLQVPELPSPPSPFDSQQDLYNLGKLTFQIFGIAISSNSKLQMVVKKYKNCVYFSYGQRNNILWYFDGRFYFGEWQVHLTGEGEKAGHGYQFVPGKFAYQGQFRQGKRNGFGKIKILNKDTEKPKFTIYEGNWVDGNKTGQGKQVDQNDIKYWGQWKENKREGFGKLKLDDGDYYQGNFQKGIKTGHGEQHFKNGDKYQGNYLSNKFHGRGKYTWKNGSIYDGQFNHGIRSGTGKWKSSQNSAQFDQYEGEYQNDKKNGYGKYKWADGSQYEGYFKDDLKEGEGTIRYKNGKTAKLLWRNGQPMKKLFSEEQRKYREDQKNKQKNQTPSKTINRNETINSNQLSINRDD